MKCGTRWALRPVLACLQFGLFAAPAAAADLQLAQALQIALEKNADIQVQAEQVSVAQAQRQQALGRFDLLLEAELSQSRNFTAQAPSQTSGRESRALEISYLLGAKQTFNNGMSLHSTLSAISNERTTPAGQTSPAQNNLKLNLTLNVPLLKGAGRDATGLELELSQLSLAASQQDLRFKTSQILLDTLSAYWDYLARVELEKLARATEARSRQLLESTQKLVEANERPRGDLVLLRADFVDKEAAHQVASQARVEARRALARVLGLELMQAEALALPADRFPEEASGIDAILPLATRLAELAQDTRADLRALQLQQERGQLQLKVAEKNRKPALDLQVGLSYGRASEGGSRYGFVTESGRGQSEPSVFATLNYQFPVANNQADGAWRERVASLTQAQIRYRQTSQTVHFGVLNAVQRLATSSLQLQAAKRSLALYELAVNQEIVKQKNGIATLIDVITVEGRFNSAQANVLQLQAEYAKALARLQHESGTILPANTPDLANQTERISLDIAALTGLQPVQKLLKLRH